MAYPANISEYLCYLVHLYIHYFPYVPVTTWAFAKPIQSLFGIIPKFSPHPKKREKIFSLLTQSFSAESDPRQWGIFYHHRRRCYNLFSTIPDSVNKNIFCPSPGIEPARPTSQKEGDVLWAPPHGVGRKKQEVTMTKTMMSPASLTCLLCLNSAWY